MATIITNQELIAAPPRQQRRYGLFDAATVVSMPERALAAGLQFFIDDCGNAAELTNPVCGEDPVEKTFEEGTSTLGTDPFWLYNRLRCGMVGRTADEIQRTVTDRLLSAEQWHVENVLWNGDPLAPGAMNLVDNPTTVIVTPLAPGAGAAISALENAFYQVHGYVGTIHINTRAEGALEYAGFLNPDAGVLRTRVGSAVSLGAGYGINGPADVAPAAGFVWAFMTGYTTVWRSEDVMARVNVLRSADFAANQWDAIAERVYAAAWSCPEVFAVQVPIAAPATAATPAVPGP